MSTRNSARRHKGSHRQKRESQPLTADRREWLKVCREEMWDENVAGVIAYWRDAVSAPLFVYFIQEDGGDAVKIGKALDPGSRLRELQCGNPRYLHLGAVILASPETEQQLHSIWHDFAYIRGEWFGGGYQDVILALATETAKRQIKAHRNGETVAAVTGYLIEDIWPDKPRTRIADGFMGYPTLDALWAAQDEEEEAV